jgi:Na+/phosphate symporter
MPEAAPDAAKSQVARLSSMTSKALVRLLTRTQARRAAIVKQIDAVDDEIQSIKSVISSRTLETLKEKQPPTVE